MTFFLHILPCCDETILFWGNAAHKNFTSQVDVAEMRGDVTSISVRVRSLQRYVTCSYIVVAAW